jgi:hypothetical protein
VLGVGFRREQREELVDFDVVRELARVRRSAHWQPVMVSRHSGSAWVKRHPTVAIPKG